MIVIDKDVMVPMTDGVRLATYASAPELMEPGGPSTGEAQAIEDAAFAHIAGAPRAQHPAPS